ncbi:MAG: glucose-1-phosphate adenylyltransferase subunit GlgD [Atopobiaceae bacterium]|nr:glucose-1-phosphate adenylyltransferase subunit GlgD [Atopobiaceae bacterium]
MARAIGLITANYSSEDHSLLTEVRPAASLPFAGRYRLIDFPLSNMVNAGLRKVGVIMPYNYRSIIDHIISSKDWNLDRKNGGLFILPGSAYGSSRESSRFLIRDIDANRSFLEKSDTEYVVMASSNVIYNMNLEYVIATHQESGADITILEKRVDADDPDLWAADIEDGRVKSMHRGVKGGELAFLDTFIAKRELLLQCLDWYQAVSHLDLFEALSNDFERLYVMSWEFKGYAASIFRTDSYYRRNMDLLDPHINADIFRTDRTIMTKAHDVAPAKYEPGAVVSNSLISAGSKIAGTVTGSVLGRNVRVEKGAVIIDSLIGQDCVIESGARVVNAIIDRNNRIPENTQLCGTHEAVLVHGKGE